MKHALEVEETAHGKRLDLFIGEKLAVSRAKLKALFEDDHVRVDGRRAKKGQVVSKGQKVEVELAEGTAQPQARADATVALQVLFEDEQLIFVNKAAGVPVQPLTAGEGGTVANALVARDAAMAAVGDDPREAGLCHRLDVETSGVLLAAKTRAAWEAMRKAFSTDDDVEKHYLALVNGPIGDSGEIELPLSHAGDHVRPGNGEGDKARPAKSAFTVLKRSGVYSLVDVQIFTGVLHQVRAHLAAIGAPIVGDEKYGGAAEPGLTRFFLHAARLSVTHPMTKKRLTVEAPLPPELQGVLETRGLSAAE